MEIAVIGGGSWGTALANHLALNGNRVDLWVYEQELVAAINQRHENELYLKQIPLHENLRASNDLEACVAGKKLVLLVPPSQLMRRVIEPLIGKLDDEVLLVSASKGIENDSLMTMHEVLEETLRPSFRGPMVFLSGPSFAREVAVKGPTAVVAASLDAAAASVVQEVFSSDTFRVYTNDDVMGVELGGSLKNVMAIAAGVTDGLGFGHNARAALITRGLAEMSRIGIAMEGQASTFSGLAGMGDLVLTCTGDLSRNRTVGIELGKGRKLKEILAGMNMVAEGVKTTLSAYQLAQKIGVDAPIIEQMYAILYQDKDPRVAFTDLMARDLKAETL
ncbi:MAG: glycerol-3-phosphate dehydrogenase [Desulfuromonas sp.]|nr:MAG: glycerol-3-phosphate dehydrogenase [Desulfuromonas sp.]